MENRKIPTMGVLLIISGALIALRAFGILYLGFWFWIGLIIAVPAVLSIIRRGRLRAGDCIWIVVGVLLMLRSLGLIGHFSLFPLIIAGILLVIGAKVIIGKNDNGSDYHSGVYGSSRNSQEEQNFKSFTYTETASQTGSTQGEFTFKKEGGVFGDKDYKETTFHTEYDEFGNPRTVYTDDSFQSRFENNHTSNEKGRQGGRQFYSAILSGRNITYAGEKFEGAELKAVLGSIDLNLRNASLSGEVVIDMKAVLGGIEIYVPRDVRVIINGSPVLGSISDKTTAPVGTVNCPVIRINATCVLGGIEVKY